MDTKQVEFKWVDGTEVKGSDGKPIPYTEICDVPKSEDAESFIKKLLETFNAEEVRRNTEGHGNLKAGEYKPCPRTFIRIVTKDCDSNKSFCELFKMNVVTVSQGGLYYDILRCKNCGWTHQRISLGDTPQKHLCTPERFCKHCNKTYATRRLCKAHMARKNHKTPHWMPNQ